MDLTFFNLRTELKKLDPNFLLSRMPRRHQRWPKEKFLGPKDHGLVMAPLKANCYLWLVNQPPLTYPPPSRNKGLVRPD